MIKGYDAVLSLDPSYKKQEKFIKPTGYSLRIVEDFESSMHYLRHTKGAFIGTPPHIKVLVIEKQSEFETSLLEEALENRKFLIKSASLDNPFQGYITVFPK